MRDIAIYFTTIMLEAIPFLLLGALISAIIEEFVSEERISKMIPKNRVLGSLVGIFLGLFIPACDCAVIPIAMRLKKKKVPTNVIVSFMLASPIISPVVLLSTFFAFGETEKMLLFGFEIPKLFVYRTIFGVLVALVVGIILDIICIVCYNCNIIYRIRVYANNLQYCIFRFIVILFIIMWFKKEIRWEI